MLKRLSRIFYFWTILVFVGGCSKKDTGPPKTVLPNPQDESVCEQKTFTDSITLSGQAIFEYRVPNQSGLSDIQSPKKIRFADIEVLSSEGCVTSGQTDKQGAFSLEVPYEDQKEYTIKVSSRADNKHVKISVQNDPLNHQSHFISQKERLDSESDVSDITLKALADETGGAFNIYDQILEANLFLKDQTQNCETFRKNCKPFTTAPKVYIYWKKGFNPVTYLSETSTSSFSFYLPERRQLFIVGGDNDDISAVNTDHFDNVIILHEYGHFIEDIFSKTDTPGGSHNARYVIDARLAWSEGFATFFANAILGQPAYIDSAGLPPNSLLKINEDLEKHPPTRDIPKADGEGNFREFSIARSLWDMLDPYTYNSRIEDQDNDPVRDGSFAEFWSVFSGPFKDKKYHFRDYGLFMSLQSQLQQKTDLSSLFEREKQRPDRQDFAAPFPIPENRQSSVCPYEIQATDPDKREQNRLLHPYPQSSNHHSSNDFYLYEHRGGTLTAQLTYSPTNNNAPPDKAADLNLYIYKDNYVYQNEDDILASSANADDGGSEFIQIEADQGTYMVNVMVWTRRSDNNNNNNRVVLGHKSTYNLTINGKSLCP